VKRIRILLAEDNTNHQRLLLLALVRGQPLVNVVIAATREDLLESARSEQFDCIVLDHNLPPYNAPEILRDLTPLQPDVPCIVISSSEEQRVAVESFREGVADFLPKEMALDGQVLWHRIEEAINQARTLRIERRRANRRLRQLQRQAETDPLTGVANRRYFERELWGKNRRTDRRELASLYLIDIDRFKTINDTQGHDVGDRVIRDVAGVIQDSLSEADILARWGGEEFIVYRQSTTMSEAWIWADDLRRAIPQRLAPLHGIDPVTVSIGVDVVPTKELNPALVTRVDRAMYLAKETGRNRVCSWSLVNAIDIAQELQTQAELEPRDRLRRLIDRLRPNLGQTQLEHIGQHGLAVRDLAQRLGRAMLDNPAVLSHLELAAEFHDIGKVAVPEEILAAPRSLSEDERRYIDEHARFGAELLRAIGLDDGIASLVEAHHTPHRTADAAAHALSDSEPATAADVLSVCDAAITMLSIRSYAQAKTVMQTLAELRAHRGSQFHPDVVDTLHFIDDRRSKAA
jgi:diguanylate cyclase (GGDEF)-like protein/putative nucleotidyltransferase with HDIG domain